MKKFYEIKMDIRANNYIEEKINDGVSLSLKVGDAIELSKGSVFTFFPNGISPTNLYDFQTGGKLPELGEETWIKGEDCVFKPTPDTSAFLIDIIREYIQKKRDNICIFENTDVRKSDPWIEGPEINKDSFFFYKDGVYHMISDRNSSIKDIKQVIDYLDPFYHFLGVMSSLSIEEQETTKNGEFSDKQWDIVLKNLKKIILGVYDGEGYLIWEKE